MSKILRTGTMEFLTKNNKNLFNHMNYLFINTYFNRIKHHNIESLKNCYVTITNARYTEIHDMPVEKYRVKFPNSCNIETNMIIEDDIKKVINDSIKRPVILHVFNEHNRFIGYYLQDVGVCTLESEYLDEFKTLDYDISKRE